MKYSPRKNITIEIFLKLPIEINGIGIVSAMYSEINELLTKKRVLNFSFIS